MARDGANSAIGLVDRFAKFQKACARILVLPYGLFVVDHLGRWGSCLGAGCYAVLFGRFEYPWSS